MGSKCEWSSTHSEMLAWLFKGKRKHRESEMRSLGFKCKRRDESILTGRKKRRTGMDTAVSVGGRCGSAGFQSDPARQSSGIGF